MQRTARSVDYGRVWHMASRQLARDFRAGELRLLLAGLITLELVTALTLAGKKLIVPGQPGKHLAENRRSLSI